MCLQAFLPGQEPGPFIFGTPQELALLLPGTEEWVVGFDLELLRSCLGTKDTHLKTIDPFQANLAVVLGQYLWHHGFDLSDASPFTAFPLQHLEGF